VNFYTKFFLSQCIFFSCERSQTISSCENLVNEQWNREDILQNYLTVGEHNANGSLTVDVYYGVEVQYQNIFLWVRLSDIEGTVVFEKKDLMLMLFDAKTGVPLGRKIFEEQHLEFLVEKSLKIKKGIYKIKISQITRAENLCGIKKIKTKLCLL
jgi:gliding motility-associated lipoprotein GldH